MTHQCRPILHAGEPPEYVCGQCGKIDEELTQELREEVLASEQAEASADSHYVHNAAHLTELGSQHGMTSLANGGLIYDLGNAWKKDFDDKKVKAATLANPNGGTSYMMKNRGTFGEKDNPHKYTADYSMDKWMVSVKQTLSQKCSKGGLDQVALNKAGSIAKKLYSNLIIGEMTKLVALMAINDLPVGMVATEQRKINNQEIVMLFDKLQTQIIEYIDRSEEKHRNATILDMKCR